MENLFKVGDYAIVVDDAHDFFKAGERVIVVSFFLNDYDEIEAYNCKRSPNGHKKVMLPDELRKQEFMDIVKQILDGTQEGS